MMQRLGLRLLLAAVVLSAIGWLSLAHWIFEVIRVSAVACLALGMFLLILDFLRAPGPSGS